MIRTLPKNEEIHLEYDVDKLAYRHRITGKYYTKGFVGIAF